MNSRLNTIDIKGSTYAEATDALDAASAKLDSIQSDVTILSGLAPITPSDDLLFSNDTETLMSGSHDWAPVKIIMLARSGVYRVKFDMRKISGTGNPVKIYKNNALFLDLGVPTVSPSYVTLTYDFAIEAGVSLELWMETLASASQSFIKNFRLYGTTGGSEFSNWQTVAP